MTTIQIFGTKKCRKTQKAERFFSDRKLKYHFVDLNVKAISKGELTSICQKYSAEDLVDTESKDYDSLGLKFMIYDAFEKLLENSLLLKTPVIRCGKLVSIGDNPKLWNEIALLAKT